MGFGKRAGVVLFLAIFALGILLFGTTLSISAGSSHKLKGAKIAGSVSASFEELPIIIELENLTKGELLALEKMGGGGRIGRISKFTNPRGSVFVEFRSSGPALESLVSSNFPAEKIVSIGDGTLRVEAHMDVSKGVAGILPENNYSLKGLARKSAAVLDTGVDANHPDLNSTRLSSWQDFVNSNPTPYDDDYRSGQVVGHGTHVLGTVAGAGIMNSSLSGVAPNSSFIALKILNDAGSGSISNIVSALSWTSANKEIYNITSASMSLGFDSNGYVDPSIDSATNALVSSGVVVVCSAGNKGDLGWRMTSPAQAVKCIAVGALSDSGNLTEYTSLGNSTRQVDILAPGGSRTAGLQINSTMSNSTGLANNYYHELAGTSMAAPHVTGAVQLIVQALDSVGEPWNYSEAQALKVKMILLLTATETNRLRENGLYNPVLNRGEPDNYEGYGRMNIDGALEAVLYNLTLNGTGVNFSLSNETSGRKVFARKVSLVANSTVKFFLAGTPGTDADIFLYSGSPDQYGRPTILNRSVSSQTGSNESFSYSPNFTGTGYLAVKFVSGTSGNLSIKAASEILNATPGTDLERNLGENGTFSLSSQFGAGNFSVFNASGGLFSSAQGVETHSFNVSCQVNGTQIFSARLDFANLTESKNLSLSCFEPFEISSFSAGNSPLWLNENGTFSAVLRSTGVDLSGASCTGNVLGDTIISNSSIALSEGGNVSLEFLQWNATNASSGELNASLNCSYLGFSTALDATFQILPAYYANFTLSDSTNATFGRGVGTISQNATGLALPPTFSFESAFLGAENVSITIFSPNASSTNWTGIEWAIFTESNENPNGSLPIFSALLNTSFNLSNFSAVFSESTAFSAFCSEAGCISGATEFEQASAISPALPAHFSVFERANATIENVTLPGSANSTEDFFVSGLALLDYLNGTKVPIGSQVNWSVSSGSLNGTVQSNSSNGGNFSLNFSAPLAGNHTLNLSVKYGVSNTAYRQFNFTTSPVCGNGFCETGEIACGCSSDCGCPTTSTTTTTIPTTSTVPVTTTVSSSGGGFVVLTTLPTTTSVQATTTTTISDPEKNAQIPGVNEQYNQNHEKRENGVFETFIFQGTDSKKPIELVPDLPGTPFLKAVSLSFKGAKNQTAIKIAPLSENLSLTKALIYSGFVANSTNPEEILSASFRFSVEESWLAAIGAHPSEVVLLRNPTGSDGWFILNATITGTNGTHFFYLSESPGFSTFAISVLSLNSRPPIESPPEEGKSAREIRIGLKLPLLVFALLLAFAYSVVFYAKIGWGQKRQN